MRSNSSPTERDHSGGVRRSAGLVTAEVGTYGRNALAVTGRLADGWIPTYGLVPPKVVTPMREQVLSAAEAAGRDPVEITCAYHLQIRVGERVDDPGVVSGSVAQVVDQFQGFVDIGFTAFSLSVAGPDEDGQLDRLGGDVLPAVRSAVAGAHAAG